VHDHNLPALLGELDDRGDTLAGPAELVDNGRGLARLRECIAAKR
jgi:hypothetical protein